MTSAVRAFLSFGSNLGDRTAYLAGGVEALGEGIEVIAISPLYETAPVGGVPQDDFLNVVVEIVGLGRLIEIEAHNEVNSKRLGLNSLVRQASTDAHDLEPGDVDLVVHAEGAGSSSIEAATRVRATGPRGRVVSRSVIAIA